MKKRSLLVATIMLLVAVLLATGTTYAWFTNAATAKATITMGVADGSSLEISGDSGNTWVSSYTNESLADWEDFSIGGDTLNANNFYTAKTDSESSEVTSYTTGTPTSLTIQFRSTKSTAVIVTNGSIDGTGASTDLKAGARILVIDQADSGAATPVMFANNAGETTGTITGTALTDNQGKYTASAFTASKEIVTLADADGDGWYTGSATFYFFIEGTKTDNADLAGADKLITSLTFTQAAQAAA